MPTFSLSNASSLQSRAWRGFSSLRAAFIRSCLFAVCLLLPLLLPGRVMAAEAAGAPAPKKFQVGSITVTALLDRPHEMDISLFSGPATPEERMKLMPGGKAPAAVNAFLIQVEGKKNILVDAGFGTILPGASQLERCLADVGLTPADIDLVLLTHMHTDHVGGLLKHKQRAFPKAKILVSMPELDYWTDLAAKDASNANAALVKTVVDVYGPDILPPFALGESVLPGVTSVNASGHTPGHSVFLVESSGKGLLILGDLLHAAALQFPLPDECASYDMDREAATKARKAILTLAAEKNIPVAGMHLPFPGMGTVKIEGAGFAFTPLP